MKRTLGVVFGTVFLLPIALSFGCAGTNSVLGTPTVVSDTAYDLAPEITNPDEVRDAMRREYPPLLRDARIRGTAVLVVFVGEAGQIQHASLEEGSGHKALDDMVLKLAEIIQFNPAQNGSEAVPVLVRVPINLVPPPAGRAVRREIGRGG